MNYVLVFFKLTGGNRHYFWPFVRAGHWWVFPGPCVIFSHTCSQFSRRNLHRSLDFHVVLPLPSILSCELSLPCSLWTVSSDFLTQGVYQVLLGYSLFVLRPRNSVKAVSWGNCRVYLACFLQADSDISVLSESTVNLDLERTRNTREKSFCPSSYI